MRQPSADKKYDANLDGVFNASDFVQVFQRGEYEDTVAQNSTWSDGVWNNDRDFNSSDFVTVTAARAASARRTAGHDRRQMNSERRGGC